VVVEGWTVFDGEVTQPGEHPSVRRPLEVRDGRLTVDIGGQGGNTTIDFLTIVSAGSDMDGDGEPNESDNCPFTDNPGQEDFDGDNVGDVCDECTDVDRDGYGRGFPADICLLDCNDDDGTTWAIPGEVTDLMVAGDQPTQLQWESLTPAAGLGVIYDLATGLLSTLSMPVPFAGACKIPGIPSPLYQDDRILSPGDGFFYLVEGINGCGDGGMGAGTTTPNYRDVLQSAPACPPA